MIVSIVDTTTTTTTTTSNNDNANNNKTNDNNNTIDANDTIKYTVAAPPGQGRGHSAIV